MTASSTPMAGSDVGHTPGPWRFDGDWHRLPTIFGAGGAMIAILEKTGPCRGDHTTEQAANARLIAAAPTMRAYIAEHASAGDPEALQILEAIDGHS